MTSGGVMKGMGWLTRGGGMKGNLGYAVQHRYIQQNHLAEVCEVQVMILAGCAQVLEGQGRACVAQRLCVKVQRLCVKL